ncbi:MAG: type II secretion system protein N [Desulfobulbus sp.]
MLNIVIRLIVITVLIYAGVQLWYGKVEKRLQEQAPSSKVVQQDRSADVAMEPTPGKSADDELQVILTRNIFQATTTGETAPETGDSDSDIDQLAQTQLSLSLLGTVTGKENDARAIIRDDKTKLEDLYQIGSEIQGAIINRITRGKVVLLVNGREEALAIKDREGEDGGARSVVPRRPGAIVKPDEAMVRPTPRAVPRRRISFRSPARRPSVVAPQEMSDAPVEDAQADTAQEVPPEAEGELNTPEQEREPATVVPAQ